VLLTRHRHACIVVGRDGDDELLEDELPPPTPAFLSWDPDPVLDGWEVTGRCSRRSLPTRSVCKPGETGAGADEALGGRS
jgi:hypothetical protein